MVTRPSGHVQVFVSVHTFYNVLLAKLDWTIVLFSHFLTLFHAHCTHIIISCLCLCACWAAWSNYFKMIQFWHWQAGGWGQVQVTSGSDQCVGTDLVLWSHCYCVHCDRSYDRVPLCQPVHHWAPGTMAPMLLRIFVYTVSVITSSPTDYVLQNILFKFIILFVL